ncbi:MAG: hypothetical protein EOO96_00730 [Pedobacter sp.]|nr:MAG: hypothetical protein EOO96_00730 [Pedobacter sp.]
MDKLTKLVNANRLCSFDTFLAQEPMPLKPKPDSSENPFCLIELVSLFSSAIPRRYLAKLDMTKQKD